MSSKRSLLVDILYDLIIFITIHLIFCLFIYYFLGASWYMASFLLLIPFYICMFVRLKSRNIFIFIIVHALVLVPCMFIPDILGKVFYGLFVAITILYSFTSRLGRNSKVKGISLIVPTLVICVICLIADNLLSINLDPVFFVINSAIVMLSFILHTHILNMDSSLAIITEFGNQPVRPILRFNNTIMLIFSLLIVLVAVFSQFIPIGEAISSLLHGLLLLIRFLASLSSSSTDEPEEIISQQQMPADNQQGEFDFAPGETHIIWIILEKIVFTAFWIALVAFIIFIIGYTIYKFYTRFHETYQTAVDTKEFISPFYSTEKEKSLTKRLSDLLPGRSKGIKIRRMFIKKVRSYLSKGIEIQKENTAKAISGKIAQYEDIAELTENYEKARYSNNPEYE